MILAIVIYRTQRNRRTVKAYPPDCTNLKFADIIFTSASFTLVDTKRSISDLCHILFRQRSSHSEIILKCSQHFAVLAIPVHSAIAVHFITDTAGDPYDFSLNRSAGAS